MTPTKPQEGHLLIPQHKQKVSNELNAICRSNFLFADKISIARLNIGSADRISTLRSSIASADRIGISRSNIRKRIISRYQFDRQIEDHIYLSERPGRSFKGYLRYKTIISQNVSSEAQIKNFFISQKNYVLFSRYSSFCIFSHPMIYRNCDVTMSIST